MFAWWQKRRERKTRVSALYQHITSLSRQPVYYGPSGVADTVEGRLSLIVLLLSLVVRHLSREQTEEGGVIARNLQEIFVADLDRSLREMGVGDMSVGKQIKAIAARWFGQLKAYNDALDAEDPAGALEKALVTNLAWSESSELAQKISGDILALDTRWSGARFSSLPLGDIEALMQEQESAANG